MAVNQRLNKSPTIDQYHRDSPVPQDVLVVLGSTPRRRITPPLISSSMSWRVLLHVGIANIDDLASTMNLGRVMQQRRGERLVISRN